MQGLEVEVPWVAPPARKVSAAVVWEPRLVPAPEVPERRYEGVVRVRVREEVSAPVVSEPRVPERSVEEAREEAAAEQEVELAPGGCAGGVGGYVAGGICVGIGRVSSGLGSPVMFGKRRRPVRRVGCRGCEPPRVGWRTSS
ncbi:hypothetical protein GCM10020001_034580 [Nonomuraea salmonea]